MIDTRKKFYMDNATRFFTGSNPSILVCGGGPFDKDVLVSCGFKNVTISNLDNRLRGDEFAPYAWAYENAESMSFADNAFDYVVIHAAIHHASSPHRVLTEMYRVARKGVMAIESRDSFTMKMFEKLGFTQVFEHAAVYYNDFKYGGVNNTHIPNYVYRWTEREIEKTIKSYAPHAKHRFDYSYATAFPVSAQVERGGRVKYWILKFAQPLFWLLTIVFKRQQNLFAFFVGKPSLPADLYPWLKLTEAGTIAFDEAWGHRKYKNEKPSFE